MARSFRVYGKKRGARRSGSQVIGTVAMGLLFAASLLGGLGFLSFILATVVIPEWRVNQRFERDLCTIVKKRIAERSNTGGVDQILRLVGWEADGPVSGRAVRGSLSYRPEFLIRYEVGGQTYETWTYDATGVYSTHQDSQQVVIDSFSVEGQYACWYDPDDPASAVLVRGYNWSAWLMLLLPVSFLVVGGGGVAYTLVYWGKSTERRAALAGRAAALDPFDRKRAPTAAYPFVPDQAHLTDSPGTTLAYRLPINTAPIWGLAAALSTAAAGVLLGGGFAYWAVLKYRGGEPDWSMTAFALVLIGAAVGVIFYFARQLMTAGAVGATILEVSQHPLYPGGTYRLFLSQSGELRETMLEVLLVCDEWATYRQGTNTRTETRRVHEQHILPPQRVQIRRGNPLESTCALEVPAGAMHSFKADYNEVSWSVVVRSGVAGVLQFERTSPLVVHPAQTWSREP